MFFLGSVRRWLRDRHRNIFRFWDGARYRYADPVAIGTRLEELDPDYQDLLDVLAKKPLDLPVGPVRDDLVKRQHEAIKKLADLARRTFDIPPLSETGEGMSLGECVGVVVRYFVFMEGLARESALFRDSQSVA